MGSRRRTLRLRCDLPARWEGVRGAGVGRVLDMSANGLLLGADDLAPGDRVEVVVDVAGEPVRLSADIRFVGPTRYGRGCGAAITPVSDDSRARWDAHYHALAERTIQNAPPSVHRYLRRRTSS